MLKTQFYMDDEIIIEIQEKNYDPNILSKINHVQKCNKENISFLMDFYAKIIRIII